MDILLRELPVVDTKGFSNTFIFPVLGSHRPDASELNGDVTSITDLIEKYYENQKYLIPYQAFFEIAEEPVINYRVEYRHTNPDQPGIMEVMKGHDVDRVFNYMLTDSLGLPGMAGKEQSVLKKIAKSAKTQWRHKKSEVPQLIKAIDEEKQRKIRQLNAEHEQYEGLTGMGKENVFSMSALTEPLPIGLWDSIVKIEKESEFWKNYNLIQTNSILQLPIDEVLTSATENDWVITSGELISLQTSAELSMEPNFGSIPVVIGQPYDKKIKSSDTYVLSSFNVYDMPDDFEIKHTVGLYHAYPLIDGEMAIEPAKVREFMTVLGAQQNRDTIFGGRVLQDKFLIDTLVTKENMFFYSVELTETPSKAKINYQNWDFEIRRFGHMYQYDDILDKWDLSEYKNL